MDVATSRRISLPGELKMEYLTALEEIKKEQEREQIASEKFAKEINVSV